MLVVVLALAAGCVGRSEPSEGPAAAALTLEDIFTRDHGVVEAVPRPGADEWIAVADLAAGRGIYRIVPQGSGEATLIRWGAGTSPRWSPDGERVDRKSVV